MKCLMQQFRLWTVQGIALMNQLGMYQMIEKEMAIGKTVPVDELSENVSCAVQSCDNIS